jgi:hypothetical protein
MTLHRHPYLDRDYMEDVGCTMEVPMTHNTLTFNISCFQHDFSTEMHEASLNEEPQSIFDIINTHGPGLCFIEGASRSRKTFFMKYLSNHLI